MEAERTHPLHYDDDHSKMVQTGSSKNSQARQDLSVILVTGSYDHEIRFWEAWSGICSRTISRSGESGVSRIRFLPQSRVDWSYSK